MRTTTNRSARTAVIAFVAGVGVATAFGMATMSVNNVHLTQSADGRTAYSWSVDSDGSLTFLHTARAEPGQRPEARDPEERPEPARQPSRRGGGGGE